MRGLKGRLTGTDFVIYTSIRGPQQLCCSQLCIQSCVKVIDWGTVVFLMNPIVSLTQYNALANLQCWCASDENAPNKFKAHDAGSHATISLQMRIEQRCDSLFSVISRPVAMRLLLSRPMPLLSACYFTTSILLLLSHLSIIASSLSIPEKACSALHIPSFNRYSTLSRICSDIASNRLITQTNITLQNTSSQ